MLYPTTFDVADGEERLNPALLPDRDFRQDAFAEVLLDSERTHGHRRVLLQTFVGIETLRLHAAVLLDGDVVVHVLHADAAIGRVLVLEAGEPGVGVDDALDPLLGSAPVTQGDTVGIGRDDFDTLDTGELVDEAQEVELPGDRHCEHQLRCIERAVLVAELAEGAVQDQLQCVGDGLLACVLGLDALMEQVFVHLYEALTLSGDVGHQAALEYDRRVVARHVNVHDLPFVIRDEVALLVVLAVQAADTHLVDTTVERDGLFKELRHDRAAEVVDAEPDGHYPVDD